MTLLRIASSCCPHTQVSTSRGQVEERNLNIDALAIGCSCNLHLTGQGSCLGIGKARRICDADGVVVDDWRIACCSVGGERRKADEVRCIAHVDAVSVIDTGRLLRLLGCSLSRYVAGTTVCVAQSRICSGSDETLDADKSERLE